MSDVINQITDAIEAEIHEAWTESDADFNRGMEYAVSIVRALDIRTDSDTISRQSALAEFRDGRDVYDIMESIEELPSAEAVEVVRCKECKWYDDKGKGCNRSGGLTMYPLHEYDHCSYAERREP